MKTFFLKPTAPFHLQTGGLDHESTLPLPKSDMVSAALAHVVYRDFGLADFDANRPFYRTSSFMPAISLGNNEYVKLYPKPAFIGRLPDGFSHKDLKKISWFDEDSLRAWADGNDQISVIKQGVPVFGGAVLLSKENYAKLKSAIDDLEAPLWKTSSTTRVVLDRVTNASLPFHFVNCHYAPFLQFWMNADVSNDKWDVFTAAIRLLGDEGLGADRSVGMGSFEIAGSFDVFEADRAKGKRWMNIGVFNPAVDSGKEIRWEESTFNIERRQGWVSKFPLRRQTVKVVAEGSVLVSIKEPKGRILKVLDPENEQYPSKIKEYLNDVAGLEHPIYRDCRGFFVPLGN